MFYEKQSEKEIIVKMTARRERESAGKREYYIQDN